MICVPAFTSATHSKEEEGRMKEENLVNKKEEGKKWKQKKKRG